MYYAYVDLSGKVAMLDASERVRINVCYCFLIWRDTLVYSSFSAICSYSCKIILEENMKKGKTEEINKTQLIILSAKNKCFIYTVHAGNVL